MEAFPQQADVLIEKPRALAVWDAWQTCHGIKGREVQAGQSLISPKGGEVTTFLLIPFSL